MHRFPDWAKILDKISHDDSKCATRLKHALDTLDGFEAARMSADEWSQFPNIGKKTFGLMVKHAPHLAGSDVAKAKQSKTEKLLIKTTRIERKLAELLHEVSELRFQIEESLALPRLPQRP